MPNTIDNTVPATNASLVSSVIRNNFVAIKNLTDGWVTPEQYGAVGDGSTDDTDAFQDAIDALDTAGGGVLQCANKVYKISGNLTAFGGTDTLIIRGAGANAGDTSGTVLSGFGSGILLDIAGACANHRTVLEDLRITGASGTHTYGVRCNQTRYVSFQRVTFGTGFTSASCLVTGEKGGAVDCPPLNTHFHDCIFGTSPIHIHFDCDGASPYIGEVSIINCMFSDSSSCSIKFGDPTTGGENIRNVKIIGNTFDSNDDKHIYAPSISNLSLIGNYFENGGSDTCLEISGYNPVSSVAILGNQFQGSVTTVLELNNVTGSIIAGNAIVGTVTNFINCTASTWDFNNIVQKPALIASATLTNLINNITDVYNEDTKAGVITKATTGDPAYGYEGQIEINTFDNKVKIYADGAWRQLDVGAGGW